MAGGPKRLPFTVPPLVFSALKVSFFQNQELKSFVGYVWEPVYLHFYQYPQDAARILVILDGGHIY